MKWKRYAIAAAGGLVLLAAWLFHGCAPPPFDLEFGDPAGLGLDPATLAVIDRGIENDVKQRKFPGAAVAIVRHGQIVHWRTYGTRTPDSDPMPDDAIYRIYSMTKPIVSVAAMQLVEAGKLDLKAPVHDYLPAFADMKVHEGGADVPARRPMTVEDLLRHTSGLTYHFTGKSHVHQLYRQHELWNPERTCSEFNDEIAALPLLHHPGEVWAYSMSTDVLGCLIEVVSGQPLDQFLQAHLFEPLGMLDTGFYVPAKDTGRLAEPNPGITLLDATKPPRFQRGGGGLMSTMTDYVRFALMLANDGALGSTRVIGADTLKQMTRDQLNGLTGGPGPAYGFGYGFGVRRTKEGNVAPGNVGDYGWSGFAGTTFWVDPVADLIVVFMVQAPDLGTGHRQWLRQTVYDAIAD